MEEVRRLRQAKGWNQNELAFHADLAPSVISLLETGKREPNATTLRKLAEALEVRIPDLFEDSGSGKAQRRSSLEPSLFYGGEDERPDSVYAPWLEFVDGYADRWEERIAGGRIDQGALDEFLGTIDGLFPILSRLGLQEKREKRVETRDNSFGPVMGEAIGRLSSLFNPLIEAGVKQEEGSDLARLRRRREEILNEQARAASG
jgi:transcriptional regulator with XRE-family HTH domain